MRSCCVLLPGTEPLSQLMMTALPLLALRCMFGVKRTAPLGGQKPLMQPAELKRRLLRREVLPGSA